MHRMLKFAIILGVLAILMTIMAIYLNHTKNSVETILEPIPVEETTTSYQQGLIDRVKQADGKPVIVSTYKFGDDVKPNYVRTYCQVLPFTRGNGSEDIHCWSETMWGDE